MADKTIQQVFDELDVHVNKAIEQIAEIISERYDDEDACKAEAEELVLDHLNYL